MRPTLLLPTVLLAWLTASGWALATPDVLIVSSEDSPPYQELIQTFSTQLAGRVDQLEISVQSQQQLSDSLSKQPPRLLLTLGVSATEQAIQSNQRVPHLAVLVPRLTYEKLLSSKPATDLRNRSAIYLDQPLDRFLGLARLVVPNLERVAILSSMDPAPPRKPLASALKNPPALVVELIESERDIVPTMQRVLPGTQALLAIPDNKVYTPHTAELVILTAYRQRVPIIGFSSTFTRAGALCSVYSTPSQIGQQAAEIASKVLSGRAVLPAPQYPQHYTISVNDRVARALGMEIKPAPILLERLHQELGEN
ncbi:ABC-type uncharacterized transport system substrate-binding protein [Chitinivorax tropicus]|uniref:ABC-type uncharacterized transport system substrate-binding protein n=1 Tax=Chitinivorax tropicus TaxID=714531 RepID=A0A840MNS1_9PROT|nr:ABC transporter substrate binding protein [Chitinivorax tropicus]MBB5016891.1 ABC-type uncharacterized transport system substrate-binding protein [Chitinivorax tropicus]